MASLHLPYYFIIRHSQDSPVAAKADSSSKLIAIVCRSWPSAMPGSFVNHKLIAFLTCLREHVTFSVHLIGAQSRLRGYTGPIHVCPDSFLSLRRGLGTRLHIGHIIL